MKVKPHDRAYRKNVLGFDLSIFRKEWLLKGEIKNTGGYFMKLVITDNLSFTDYYHGNCQ